MASPPKRKREKRGTSSALSKVFRDPVHDLIHLGPEDDFILDLIETKEFQRLRRIRQLGLTHFVYPGAEHTRFAHSLGVFNFARRMIEGLRSRSTRGVSNELKNNARIIKAAALLHDIGHGPFSHVFERVFDDEHTVDHEQWTCKILLNDSTEVAEVLRKRGIDAKQVVALVCDAPPDGVDPPAHPYLKDIVHSQLDADRMDYLLRDSLMTGSRYGDFDSEWILNVLTLGETQSRPKKVRKLCLDLTKGTGALEKLLHARLLMTKYVYGHKTTRAYEAELVRTLQLAGILAKVLPKDTPPPVREVLERCGQVGMKDYLMLDDEVIWWALRRWAKWSEPPRGGDPQLVETLRRHSLRLVRRSKPWITVPLTDGEMLRGAAALDKELRRDQENPLRHECYLDTMTTWPYKDPAAAVRAGADLEQAYFEDIHVLKGKRAVPIQEAEDTPILGALAVPWEQRRFHYDREFDKEFRRLITKYGIR